jgi:KUP system potassium uptake protein
MRMNLRHLIGRARRPSTSPTEDGETYYYLRDRAGYSDTGDEEPVGGDKGKELPRIDSCAVFHKITSGRGVPHTFIGFIRRWPSLPRVVIFLSVCLVPRPRVPVDERYVVSKVRTVEGFYGATYYIGFRDKFDVKIGELIDKIIETERESNPEVKETILEEIRAAASTATHIIPHYHVVSRAVRAGKLSFVLSYIRALLIESIYRRLATMFPGTENWLTSADEIIHVGINAVI